jgi:hypothetical protein
MAKNTLLIPERELAAYWQQKAASTHSDFDTLGQIPLTDDRTL